MKKLMVLGAGEAQLQIIEESIRCGYYTIVCDMRPDMDGARIANKYFEVDYTDRQTVLEIAEKEQIDGITSNSEAAMANVAWISEKLNLPGNPESSIRTLLSKSKFRDLQEHLGLFCPKHIVVSNEKEVFSAVKNIGFPVIIKPVLSSGSRGTTVITHWDEDMIRDAYSQCANYSRNGKVSVEQYVEMSSLIAYDAEIFVCDGEILWDGLYASIRSDDAPMLPIMESLPLMVSNEGLKKIKTAVGQLIHESGIKLGEYNAETYFTTSGDCFVIEINPRQAGNHIPDLVYEHSGVNFTKLLCTTAVGDYEYLESTKETHRINRPVTMFVVYAEQAGKYEGLEIDKDIQQYVVWSENLVKIGEIANKKENAGDAVAFVRMQFDSIEQQEDITDRIIQLIRPVIRQGEIIKEA